MKKKICILLDHPSRDLDYVTLLSLHLIKLNFEIYIVEAYKQYEIILINPDYLLLPHKRSNFDDLIESFLLKS